MAQQQVEMYWDAGSTNAYFALKLITPLLTRYDAELVLHPFNLGYVFRQTQFNPMTEHPLKQQHRRVDLERWAKKYNLPFRMPQQFPIKSSRILRGSLVMRQFGQERAFVDQIMSRYWEHDDASVADYAGMHGIVQSLGVDATQFERLCESAETGAALAESTDRGMARGVFGAPTIIVGDALFWGKDRLDFVEDALKANA